MKTIKLKRPHQAQQEILREAKRFNVLKCGRRFGKTILTENLSIKPSLDGKTVGYWSPTYKDMNKVWDEIKYILYPVTERKDEQLKQIRLITGGQIDFWSLEDPNNGRGFSYHRIIVDECEKARHFKQAWELVIRATLTDFRGDAWFMSTPKFGQTYFKEITKNKFKAGFEDWNSWVKTSYDNPFLSKDEIDAAKSQLDELTFRCEYLAEDVDIVGNPFAYAFSESKHVVDSIPFNSEYEIFISFDFNVEPLAYTIYQHYNETIFVIGESRNKVSDIYQVCDELKSTYPYALMLVTGDATGQARSAISRGNINYFEVIKKELQLGEGQMKQPSINPAVRDSRVLLNSLLQNYKIFISKDACPNLINDLKYVEVDETGDIKKDRSSEAKKADYLDSMRYYMNTFHNSFIKHFLS